jgi:hypothetical protein
MKSDRRIPAIAALLAGAVGLASTACATPPNVAGSNGLEVQASAATHFEIKQVRVRREQDAMSVSGDVSRLLPQRGLIPGRVEVRVIGPDGATLATDSTDPMRRNRQARTAHFYIRLPVAPPAGSTLRITHQLG